MRIGFPLALGLIPVLLLAGCKRDHGDHDHQHHDHGAVAAPVPATGGAVAAPVLAAANTKCPITGDPVDAAVTVAFEGKKVAFCCKDCIPEWNKLSVEEKRARIKP